MFGQPLSSLSRKVGLTVVGIGSLMPAVSVIFWSSLSRNYSGARESSWSFRSHTFGPPVGVGAYVPRSETMSPLPPRIVRWESLPLV
jgi:hypothetical protein